MTFLFRRKTWRYRKPAGKRSAHQSLTVSLIQLPGIQDLFKEPFNLAALLRLKDLPYQQKKWDEESKEGEGMTEGRYLVSKLCMGV